jgi:hypothetical protein
MSKIDNDYEYNKAKVGEITVRVGEICTFAQLYEPEHYVITVAAYIFNEPTHFYYCISFKTNEVPYVTVMDLMSFFKEIRGKLFIDFDYTKK